MAKRAAKRKSPTRLDPAQIKDRVKEFTRLTGDAFRRHDGNWRTHPEAQRESFRSLAADIGIAGALLAWESPRYGGLTLLDGHMRIEEAPDVSWPCLILDITDDEADRLLLELDPMTGMAQANVQALALLREAREGSGPIDTALAMMQTQAEIMAEVDAIMTNIERREKLGGKPKTISDHLYQNVIIRVTFAVDGDELSAFERAIIATGLSNRASAIKMISDFYLESHADG